MKLSIIMPVKNGEKYIKCTLDSIFSQTYKDFELIIINDGSDDGTARIIQEYKLNNNLVILTNKKCKGVSYSRNLGIRHSSGDYIAFCDADDVIASNMYELLIKELEHHKADVCACQVFKFQGNLPEIQSVDNYETEIFIEKEIIRSLNSPNKENSVRGFTVNKVYNRKIINNIQFEESIGMCEDSLFSFQVLGNTKKAVLIKVPLYFYRIYSESTTYNSDIKKYMGAIKVYSFLVSESKGYDTEVYYNYLREYIDWLLIVAKKVSFPQDLDDYKIIQCKLRSCLEIRNDKKLNVSAKKWVNVWLAVNNFSIFKNINEMRNFIKEIAIKLRRSMND